MNSYIKGLYNMASYKDNQGITKLDEQKMKRILDGNKKLLSRNSELFKEEPRFHTCDMYKGCPICDKCLNKASHLYIRCLNCTIPKCVHKYKDKKFMIRRDNFKISCNSELAMSIRKVEEDFNNNFGGNK